MIKDVLVPACVRHNNATTLDVYISIYRYMDLIIFNFDLIIFNYIYFFDSLAKHLIKRLPIASDDHIDKRSFMVNVAYPSISSIFLSLPQRCERILILINTCLTFFYIIDTQHGNSRDAVPTQRYVCLKHNSFFGHVWNVLM